eukprot:CAMPEP_0177638424 /NCGR_PEP_ID=MMETSP0447-20121125/5481_1 /TAXON_ID=0 /ORGANISM="Stygamoeba regulata, Strain BSH-02190019" /LENGTH=100 /DNA_ID=CAMNT_0019140385 /DNA_START=456 /DNA_END=758 /DNA_ORIENTATION=-
MELGITDQRWPLMVQTFGGPGVVPSARQLRREKSKLFQDLGLEKTERGFKLLGPGNKVALKLSVDGAGLKGNKRAGITIGTIQRLDLGSTGPGPCPHADI